MVDLYENQCLEVTDFEDGSQYLNLNSSWDSAQVNSDRFQYLE